MLVGSVRSGKAGCRKGLEVKSGGGMGGCGRCV
jgi:hypothetical protein